MNVKQAMRTARLGIATLSPQMIDTSVTANIKLDSEKLVDVFAFPPTSLLCSSALSTRGLSSVISGRAYWMKLVSQILPPSAARGAQSAPASHRPEESPAARSLDGSAPHAYR